MAVTCVISVLKAQKLINVHKYTIVKQRASIQSGVAVCVHIAGSQQTSEVYTWGPGNQASRVAGLERIIFC